MSYLPKYESVEAVRGQIIRRARPLFPGYIFFALVDAWRSVFDSEYIRGVLMGSEEHPSTLPSWKNREGFGGANHRREATAEK